MKDADTQIQQSTVLMDHYVDNMQRIQRMSPQR
jgi:hypothetical protein